MIDAKSFRQKQAQTDPQCLIDSVFDEFGQVRLGDKRRVERLLDVVEALVDQPDVSFPQAVAGDEAKLKGLYRFFSNNQVTLDRELGPHLQACWRRASLVECCFAVHDSSELVYNTLDDGLTREGLEKASKYTQRLHIHPTLMVAADGSRMPLGLAAMMTWARTPEDRQGRQPGWVEKQRWLEQAIVVEEKAGASVDIIHLMDRDADHYDLLDGLLGRQARFVIRMRYDRNINKPSETCITKALADVEPRGQRIIKLSKRGTNRSPDKQKKHHARQARAANVSVRSTCVRAPRPHSGAQHSDDELEFNVVEVLEPCAPEGEEPVRWYLLTTEPVATEQQCWAVVDAYCTRWTIEEYFKALKTGCAVEERQLKSRDSIEAMLGVMLPLAWRLLLMRYLPRVMPQAPADALFLSTELAVLRAAKPGQLSEAPTIEQACAVLAALGGHLKRSGDPGWQTLWRGYQRLRQRHEGYLLARKEKCGQG